MHWSNSEGLAEHGLHRRDGRCLASAAALVELLRTKGGAALVKQLCFNRQCTSQSQKASLSIVDALVKLGGHVEHGPQSS